VFPKITDALLEAHLKCRYKSHLLQLGEHGEPHDYEALCREDRETLRPVAVARLLERHAGQDVPRGLPLTAEVLRRGYPLLLDVTLEDEEFAVRFDALLRADGPSSLGDFHFIPVLFHEAERPSLELRILLAMYGTILGAVQGKEPAAGLLIHGRECKDRKIKFASVRDLARRHLRELRESRGNEAPRLVLNAHCQVCEFRRRCHAEATAKDDLSLLRGMAEAEVRKYARRGLFTVTQLSCTFRPPRRCKRPEDRKVTHSHALQALAIREKKVHVLGSPELPTSAKRIYFDIEGDPERGFSYLIGVIVQDGEAEERHSLWIDSAAEEPQLFDRFLALVARHEDSWLYTYGSYEAAFLRRVGKALGRLEEVEQILVRTLNVLSVLYTHVYLPVYSNGLKDVARYLGFVWTESDASGVQSVVWRRRWEETGAPALREKLTTYNLEDCEGLRRVSEFLYMACGSPQKTDEQAGVAGRDVTRDEEMGPVSSRQQWCAVDFAVADFEFVNERAYFDYQRDRIYVRTSKIIKKSQNRSRAKKGKRTPRANQSVEMRAEKCPFCGATDLTLTSDGRLARLGYDLRITCGGIRRCVTRFTTSWHHCAACGKRFLPRDYLRLEEHFHSLKSWTMYEYVAHRTSLANIAETIRDCFGLPIRTEDTFAFKQSLARYYEGTYTRLLERIRGGSLVHADETEITLRQLGRGYVWVFTSLEEVVFLYRQTREGDFLHDLLKGFRGVLVSDFYAAYDALDCPQQKCLVHLIRDFNQDIQSNPWDEELKELAGKLGSLLRGIVTTVDHHGLKRRHLGKHKREVDRFFEYFAADPLRSEVAEGCRARLLKCRDKLFTFLDHDGVPWNNNPAEHAVKQFAYYREQVDGQITENGLKEYLVLLSIYLTCKYKGISFLKFLLSGETDIDAFCASRGRKRPMTIGQTHPEGVRLPRPSRCQTWDKESLKGES
jgi:predicted RecB family nuclease